MPHGARSLSFISRALARASDGIPRCIDVAFVENPFWQVPSARCSPYWQQMPQPLRDLYLELHRREP
ncbi:DUF7674 family protein [Ideonella azotifigens]|uniref:DUF7674 family protein n=1 Tax=Ideonella azotifigens TaxID=513160 RepID=UPI003CD088A8